LKRQVKDRVNYAYGWMESNPATAALVSGGAAAVLAVALTLALGLYTQATYVPKSACTKNPASAECAQIRLEIAKAEPLRNPCASYQRVTSRRGRNCKHFYVPRRSQRDPSFRASSGGDALDTGSTGTLQPGPHEEGSVGSGKGRGGADDGSGGGQGKAPTPSPDPGPVPSGPSPQPSPGRSSDAPGNPDPPPSSPGTVPSTVEGAGGGVKEAGEGVGGAVEGVGKGVDCALRGGC
jgi:hypothetical protein